MPALSGRVVLPAITPVFVFGTPLGFRDPTLGPPPFFVDQCF